MASESPRPDRCGAKLRNRDVYCERRRLKGKKRCKLHGGNAGRPPTTGRYSDSFKNIAAEGQAALDAIMADPNLMDPKRPVALAQYLVSHQAFPTEALAKRLAKSRLERRGDKREPTDDEIMLAHAELIVQSSKSVDLLGRRQESAFKQMKTHDLLEQAVLPMISDFMTQVQHLMHKYVDEKLHKRLDEDLVRAVHHLAGRITST